MRLTSTIATLILVAIPVLVGCSKGGSSDSPTITVDPPWLNISPSGQLPQAIQDQAYTATFTVTGGTAPYRFTLPNDPLPAGLTLDPDTGRVSGTPTTSGETTFTLLVTDSSDPVVRHSLPITLKVLPPTLTVTPGGALTGANLDWPYWVRFQVAGGQSPYTFAVISGQLPPGLELDPQSGELMGTPAVAGPNSFTIQASDGGNPPITGTVSCDLTVGPAWSTADPTTLKNTFFIHHSVGSNLLNRGPLRTTLLAHNFLTINPSTSQNLDMTYGQGLVAGPPAYTIGDHTDPPDWPVNFNTPEYFQVMYTWNLPAGQHHQVMMFKSCYPSSAIDDEQELQDYKDWYMSLLPTFQQYPTTLFVPFSTPPLNPAATNTVQGALARRFSIWLKYEYSAQLPNVIAFDFFNILANDPTHATEPNMLNALYRSGTDSHPTAAGDQAVTAVFLPWLCAALRAAGLEP